MSEIVKPTIHINGTSGQELLDQYQQARSYIDVILNDNLLSPNPRDYSPHGNESYKAARQQYGEWVARLCSIREGISEIERHIADQIAANDAMRRPAPIKRADQGDE